MWRCIQGFRTRSRVQEGVGLPWLLKLPSLTYIRNIFRRGTYFMKLDEDSLNHSVCR
jgi:hypothetical protein